MALLVEGIVLILSAAMAVSSGTRMTGPISTSPWLMPVLVSSATAACALVLLVSDVRLLIQRRLPVVEDRSFVPQRMTRVAGWLILAIAYAIVTPILGFEWATAIFLLIALWVFSRANLLVTVGIAATIAVLLPLIFRHVFHTLVP